MKRLIFSVYKFHVEHVEQNSADVKCPWFDISPFREFNVYTAVAQAPNNSLCNIGLCGLRNIMFCSLCNIRLYPYSVAVTVVVELKGAADRSLVLNTSLRLIVFTVNTAHSSAATCKTIARNGLL